MSPGEDSPPRFGASNEPAGPWTARLARACSEVAHRSSREAVGVVLEHLREASGAERAFVLEAAPPPRRARVAARAGAWPDERGAFSMSLAARALAGERPLFWPDLRREPIWADGASVRSLGLRAALCTPLPARDGRRAALVLDSRAPLSVDATEAQGLLRAFAGLIAVLRRDPIGEPPTPAAHRSEAVGRAESFLRLQDDVRAAAAIALPALVVGESGSGKELVARALHELGPRARRPFVAVNCAAIPEALLERELFGAIRGAFTGADRDHPGLLCQADGGTVLLDEIGDMPLPLQAKLLRVLQERAVRPVGGVAERAIDVRVVAATHRDLARLVRERRFRADLRWRLEVLVLRVPPLRERAGDLPLLADRLIERLASESGLARATLEPAALERLGAHAWPGNVRELEAVLARALLRTRGGIIREDDLEIERMETPDVPETERDRVERALAASRGNLTAAAERLGWSRPRLYRRLAALGFHKDEDRGNRTEEAQDSSEAGGTSSSHSSTFQ